MNMTQILISALIVEALWETSKMFWQNGKINYDRIGAVAFGELIALSANIDFLAAVGVNMRIPIAGNVLTGLLISRGANFMHDILASVGTFSNNIKQK